MSHFSFWAPRLSVELAEYIKQNKMLPDFPNIDELSRDIANKVILDVEHKNTLNVGEEMIFTVLKVEGIQYVTRIAERIKLIWTLEKDVKKTKVILVIGAGLSSEAGLPLTSQLRYILMPMGFPIGTLKDVEQAFKIIHSDSGKDKDFKNRFITILEKGLSEGSINITKSYNIIAQSFLDNRILEIVCLNWDNLLERAYEKLTHAKIQKIRRNDIGNLPSEDKVAHFLWKMHGDVEDPEYEWIYPGMQGRVFTSFENYCKVLVESLRDYFVTMLVVGYSELDEEIQNGVIELVAKSFPSYRIGMDLDLMRKHENYILAPAEWVLSKISL